MTEISKSRGRLAIAIVLFLIGLAIFLDDLHDFIPGTDWLHWLPDFPSIIIYGFHFQHLYVGVIIMLIALIMAKYA